MAKDKPSFILYADLIHVIKKLVLQDRANNTNHAGELFLHILEYVNDTNPIAINFIIDMAFEPIKLQLKRDLKKYELFREKQAENGKMGGRPPKEETQINPNNPSLISESQKSLTVNDSVTVTDNVTATVNENVTEIEIKPALAKKYRKKRNPDKQPLPFRESEYFDKEKFCLALENSPPPYCNADSYFYYERLLNGSDSKGYKYLDWLATARNWIASDIQKGVFKTRVQQTLNIAQSGKPNYQNGRKQAGHSDSEYAEAMARIRGTGS